MRNVAAIMSLVLISSTAFADEYDISNDEFLNMVRNNFVKQSILNNYNLSNGKATQGPRSMGPMGPYEIMAKGKLKNESIVISIDDDGKLSFLSCDESFNSVCK